MSDARRSMGTEGESLAARFLSAKGLTVIARQYRTRLGEIDLIVLAGMRVRFVEVKTRAGQMFGQPEEAVTAAKLRKIAAVGEQFLASRGWQHYDRQIDVVAVRTEAPGAPAITHLENVGDGFA